MKDIDTDARCEIVRVLHEARALRANPVGRYGLCATLELRALPDYLVDGIFKSWPHYTGCISYPVPCPGALPLDTDEARGVYRTTGDMYVGEYGALRLNLLDHLIAELEEVLG